MDWVFASVLPYGSRWELRFELVKEGLKDRMSGKPASLSGKGLPLRQSVTPHFYVRNRSRCASSFRLMHAGRGEHIDLHDGTAHERHQEGRDRER